MIARRHASQAVLIGSSLLDDVDGILDDRVYLGIVFLHVTLSQFEQRTLCLLHQIVDINGLVEGLGLDIAGKGNELTGQRLLGNNAGVILDIGRRSHTAGEFRHIAWTTNILKVALFGQLFSNSPHIDRRLVEREFHDGAVHFLVARLIEALGQKHLANHGIGVLVNHQGTQNGTLYLRGLRLDVGITIIYRLLSAPAVSTRIIVLFWHSFFVFGLQRYEKATNKRTKKPILFKYCFAAATQHAIKALILVVFHVMVDGRNQVTLEDFTPSHLVDHPLNLAHMLVAPLLRVN